MFDTSKRKNEDKPKNRPLHPLLKVLWLGMVLLASYPLYVLFHPTTTPDNGFPSARLQYDTDNKTYQLNLQTGERTLMPRPTPMALESEPHVNPRQAYMTLSPNGQWIAYWELVTEYYEWKLMLKSAAGSETRELGVYLGGISQLSWTPDSQWIAFSAHESAATDEAIQRHETELWMIQIDTEELIRLTNNHVADADPALSPDGTQIVYLSSADGYNRLYIMDVATRESRLLTPQMHGYRPIWSPDGRWIAFMTTSYDYNGDIWIIRADGADAQAITIGTTRDDRPIWLP